MKTLFTFLFIFGFAFQNFSQDIDVYKKDRNDNYKMPKINNAMTYEEFELLSQNMRMKDMLYAGVVPGYVHFKANDKKTGYWLLGIRSASYITMGVVYYSGKYNISTLEYESLSEEDKETLDRHETAFYTALTIATASYIYDVIHGDAVLHRKQEKIRYKYSIKAGQHPTGFMSNNSLYPNLAVAIQF